MIVFLLRKLIVAFVGVAVHFYESFDVRLTPLKHLIGIILGALRIDHHISAQGVVVDRLGAQKHHLGVVCAPICTARVLTDWLHVCRRKGTHIAFIKLYVSHASF